MSADHSRVTGDRRHDREQMLAAADGAHAVVSMLFVDIVNSTHEVSALEPEEARDALDEALQPILARIHQLNGTVARVQGDGVMAVFGAPAPMEDHALRACIAAHRIAKDVRATGRRAVRIGVHSARILTRMQQNDFGAVYDLVGAGVHVAKQIEEGAPPNIALISQETLDLAGPAVVARPWKAAPGDRAQGLHELRDVVLDHDLARQFSSDHALPFVGRDAVVERLLALVAEPAATVRTCAIVGEAGLGKSRLLFELAKVARDKGFRVEELRGLALHAHVPFAPLKALVRRLLNIADGDELASIISVVEGLGSESSNAILELLDLSPLDPEWNERDGIARRRSVLSTGKALLERTLRAKPCVLLVEDLHYLDAETLSFLALLKQARDVRLAIVMTARNAARANAATLADETIDIAPLSSGHAHRLADHLTRGHSIDAQLIDHAVARAEGNPLFLQALIRDVRHGKYAGAPPTITTLLQARVARLSAKARDVLYAAAVLGEEIEGNTLSAMAGVEADELPALFSELGAHDLMNADGAAAIRFRHDLFRAAAYDLLLRKERTALHHRALAAYEQAEPSGRRFERLAHHAQMTGDVPLALKHILAGAKLAMRTSSHATMRGLYDWAMRLRDGAPKAATPLLVEIAAASLDALQQAGEAKIYEAALEFIIAEASAVGDRRTEALARAHMALLLWMRAEHEAGRRHAEAALEIARALDSLPLRALAQPHLANIEHALGNLDRAIELHLEIVEALESAGEKSDMGRMIIPIVRSRAFAAWFLAERGAFAESEKQIASGEAVLAVSEQPYSRVLINAAKGILALRAARPADAVAPLAQARDFCLANRVYVMEPCLSAWLATALANIGKSEEARAVARKSIDEGFYLHGGRYTWVYIFQALAEAEIACGDLGRASAAIERALEIALESAEPIQIASARYIRGKIKRAAGDANGAAQDLRSALELATRHGLSPLLQSCLQELGADASQRSERDDRSTEST